MNTLRRACWIIVAFFLTAVMAQRSEADIVYFEDFSTDVIGSGGWIASDDSIYVDTVNGWLHIGSDGSYSGCADKLLELGLPITIETRSRLISGGWNYTLPTLGVFWGATDSEADYDYITYLPGAGYGWRFGNEWTDVHTNGPTTENQWTTIRVVIRPDGGELWAKSDSDPDFALIVSKSWSIPDLLVKLRFVQNWDAICDMDYISISSEEEFCDGFEGGLVNWTAYQYPSGWTAMTFNPHSGQTCAAFTFPSGAGYYDASMRSTSGQFNVEAGVMYHVTFWIREQYTHDTSDPDASILDINLLDGGSNPRVAPFLLPISSEWHLVEGTVTASVSGPASIDVQLHGYATSSDAVFAVDDICVAPFVLPSSLSVPSLAARPCDSCEFGQPGPAQGYAVQPVACDLAQEAVAATVSLKIPDGVEVCDVSFTGLITESWDYKVTTIKADSGFLTVGLANTLGQRIPVGATTLFNIEYIAPRSCRDSYYIHWDTALSASAGRRLEFADINFQGFVPTFDFGRDSTEILGYRPGDANNDGDVTIGDISKLIDHLFISGVRLCNLNATDVNGSCGADATISDVALLIDTLFVSGAVPLQCGCINQGGPALKSSFAGVSLQSTFENGVTTISVNSPVALRGLQVELSGPENASPVNLVNDKLNQFYGQTGDLVRLGMIDVDGGQTVSAGVTEVVQLAGEYTLISGVVVDNQLSESVVLLGGDLIAETLPITFGLAQNYPNPFNPVTEITFALPVAADVRLEVFNVLGQKVATLVEQRLEAGQHSITWDAIAQASGVYMYRLTAGDFVETKKMILMK